MDGTINYFDQTFVKHLLKAGYDFDWQNYNTWKIEDFIRGSDHPHQLMDEICRDMQFWRDIPPMPGAAEVLKELNNYYNIVVVTNPWDASDDRFKKIKMDWLREHFGFLRKNAIVFTADKWNLEGDIIFDDKPKILEKCIDKMITVKSIQPYNVNIESDFEFQNWKQVTRIMKTINKFFKENK